MRDACVALFPFEACFAGYNAARIQSTVKTGIIFLVCLILLPIAYVGFLIYQAVFDPLEYLRTGCQDIKPGSTIETVRLNLAIEPFIESTGPDLPVVDDKRLANFTGTVVEFGNDGQANGVEFSVTKGMIDDAIDFRSKQPDSTRIARHSKLADLKANGKSFRYRPQRLPFYGFVHDDTDWNASNFTGRLSFEDMDFREALHSCDVNFVNGKSTYARFK